MIKDSGERRTFASGAVRDCGGNKGRCDLLPLGVVGDFYRRAYGTAAKNPEGIFNNIAWFQVTGSVAPLYEVLRHSRKELGFESYSSMFLEVAQHFEEGCAKYGENNWQKGIPTKCYIDSAVRHLLKYLRGDVDEPHNRAFVWNIMCCIWTCINKPEMNNYASVCKTEASEKYPVTKIMKVIVDDMKRMESVLKE
jgi:hypothetical protein